MRSQIAGDQQQHHQSGEKETATAFAGSRQHVASAHDDDDDDDDVDDGNFALLFVDNLCNCVFSGFIACAENVRLTMLRCGRVNVCVRMRNYVTQCEYTHC